MNRFFLSLSLVLLGICSIATGLSAQKTFSSSDPAYKENVEAGETALGEEKYQECLDFYAAAFGIKQTSFLSTLRAAACAYSAGQVELRDKYLDRAFGISPGGSKEIFGNREEFAYLRETEFADLIQQRFLLAFPDYDQKLADRLTQVGASDQAQRRHMRTVSDQYGWKSPQMDSLWALQNYSDSVNTLYITELIDERGYPGSHLVGDQANVAFLVIQHAELPVQEKYLPVLREAAAAGQLSKSSLALLIDRVEMRNDRPQIYGSQVQSDPESGEHYFAPIAEPYKVDSLRESVGLGPLTEYAGNWDFTYDPVRHIEQTKKREAAKKN